MSGEALAPSGFVEGVKDWINPHPGHEFQWTISEVIQALLDAGLQLRSFNEYPYSNGGKLWDNMREAEGGRIYPPEGMPSLPLMFSLVLEKPDKRSAKGASVMQETPTALNRRSAIITAGDHRAPNRSMLRAVGFRDDDFSKPIIGIANAYSDLTPCNAGLDAQARAAAEAITAAGGDAAHLRHDHDQRRRSRWAPRA